MELTAQTQLVSPLLSSTPAVIALIIKACIFLYARQSKTHNYQTQIFLFFLFALSVQNIAEVAHFYVLANGAIPNFEVRIYYMASVAAGALLLHLSIVLAWKQPSATLARSLYRLWYVYAGVLMILLASGDWVIQGFEPIVYTVTRIPGPLFGLLEIFAFTSCGVSLIFFLVGTLLHETPRQRAQNALLLTAVLPMIIVVVTVLALLHFNIKWLNATIILPMGITFFLVVAAYAIHHHRIFDIIFYVPWSEIRRKKIKFHNRIRELLADIKDLSSADQLVEALSEVLQCPVSLVNCFAASTAGDTAPKMTRVNRSILRHIHELTIAREVAKTRPELHAEMRSHGIAAVVPFNPQSNDMAGWLLIGEPFESHIYSNSDFGVIDDLFKEASELFLNKFVNLRVQLSAANQHIEALRSENKSIKSSLKTMQQALVASEKKLLPETNKDVITDISYAARASNSSLPISITLLGRDKDLARHLRDHFSDVKTYVGVSSRAFQRAGRPQVLVSNIEDEQTELAGVIGNWKSSTAVILYGTSAREFANQHNSVFSGGLIDIVDRDVSPALLVPRLRALSHLHKHCFFLRNRDVPLIGVSPAFKAYMRRLEFLSRFAEPVLICFESDTEQFVESAYYLHSRGGRDGEVIGLDMMNIENFSLDPNRHGTVAVPYIDPTSAQTHRLIELVQAHKDDNIRFIIGYRNKNLHTLPSELEKLVRGFYAIMPTLAERAPDIPLLAHYFVLQFNLHSPVRISFDDDDLRLISGSEALLTVELLQSATFEHLSTKGQETTKRESAQVVAELDVAVDDRTLDEMVSEFESQIIRQTLRRCDGNKSKAARVLGLRPNTLHYKIERYGIGDKTQRRRQTRKTNARGPESDA